jgi:hypothetical protein
MQKAGRADAALAAWNVCQDIAGGMATGQRRLKLCCGSANQPASSAANMITALI